MGRYDRTKAALAAYDAAVAPEEAALPPEYQNDEARRLGEAVGAAFGADTSDINNPETCRALIRPGPPTPRVGETDVSFVRRIVRGHA